MVETGNQGTDLLNAQLHNNPLKIQGIHIQTNQGITHNRSIQLKIKPVTRHE